MLAIIDLQNRDSSGSTSVDYAFVIFHRDKQAFISNNWPIFNHQVLHKVLDMLWKTSKIQLLVQLIPVQLLIKKWVESRVDFIKRRRWMLVLPQYSPAIHITKEVIKLIGLIQESAIIMKDISSPPAFLLFLGWSIRLGKRLSSWNIRRWKRKRRRIRCIDPTCADISVTKSTFYISACTSFIVQFYVFETLE